MSASTIRRHHERHGDSASANQLYFVLKSNVAVMLIPNVAQHPPWTLGIAHPRSPTRVAPP
jgi:hypothetical protein